MNHGRCLVPLLVGPFATLALVVAASPGDPSAAVGSPAQLADDALVPDAYRPLVEAAAQRCAEISAPLLAAQIHAESTWDPRQVSHRGARGLAQFTNDTWSQWGRDADGDGRSSPHDPADAIDAQARYLCHLVDELSDVPGDPIANALAGYHAGPHAIRSHGGIPPAQATRDYVARVNALIPRYQATHASTDCTFALSRPNPRTCQEAIAAARREARSGDLDWHRLCLAFVAEAYGWRASGEATANAAWNRMLATGLAHHDDPHPPAGALLFYATDDEAGHVALHLGGGEVATNDIVIDGRIDIVPLDDLTEGRWNLTYRGWAPPEFPQAAAGASRVG
ncbi:lytic transglycosylase domain-containing protein [Streptomyces sp. 4N509B]|uniref:lytic transglycosylase domain-containing protein n=1 Tax=Streptomyces sp. 4N509B TaxID=3457413 RepID=UPI003FD51321